MPPTHTARAQAVRRAAAGTATAALTAPVPEVPGVLDAGAVLAAEHPVASLGALAREWRCRGGSAGRLSPSLERGRPKGP